MCIVSIDPPGCKDIDDALHARDLPNGNVEVGIHIADVTYYMKHNSALDKEVMILFVYMMIYRLVIDRHLLI